MADQPNIDPRVILAAERTLLAWIRTGLALMGFGFVVARFGVFLRELAAAATHATVVGPSSGTPVIGVAIVGAGVFVNAWASLRHRQITRQLTRGEPFEATQRGPITLGVATAVGGAILIAVLAGALRY
jgi:putative membrane protein